MKQDIPEYLVDSFIDYKGDVHQIVLCALSQSPESIDSDNLMVAWSDGETIMLALGFIPFIVTPAYAIHGAVLRRAGSHII